MKVRRREFLSTAAILPASFAIEQQGTAQNPAPMHDHASHIHPRPERPKIPRLPAVLCGMTNTVGIDDAYDMLKGGGDTLDAALHVTKAQEDDSNDATAGLGGLPNAEGEVELDACCLHGPTRRGAAVGGVTGIRNASVLARAVMQHTGYSLLTGLGAQEFAIGRGFAKEDLLTERSRKVWMAWKQIRSRPELLGSVIYDPEWPEPGRQAHFLSGSQRDLDLLVHRCETFAVQAGLGPQWTWRAAYDALFPAATPLYISTINAKREMSSAVTTSGLPWRMPGVTSDVAALGNGAYLDPEIGSAGASGSAEANTKIAGSYQIVENMRKGMPPDQAGMDALRRIVNCYRRDLESLRFVEMVYYILRKDGAYACVSLWHGDRTGHARQYTIHDGVRRSEDCLFLLDGNPPNGCSNWSQLHV